MRQILRRHGRTHRPPGTYGPDDPGGSDPITVPSTGGTFDGIYGSLYNDANVIDGIGFTAEWNEEDLSPGPYDNVYTIRFDTPFSNPPDVYLAGNNNNPPGLEGRYTVTYKTKTVDYIVVVTADLDDADLDAQDGGFDFLCIEPNGMPS